MSDEVKWALASPLGGAGFGMACFTTGFSFTGLFPVSEGFAMFLPMVLLYAGLAQFVAGIIEFARGSHGLGFTHGTYGVWGMGTALLFYTQLMNIVPAASSPAMAVYWTGWAIITIILTGTTWPISKMFSGALAWLVIVFLLFAGSTVSPGLLPIAAWLTVLLALYVWYIVAAFSINTSFGRQVLPVS